MRRSASHTRFSNPAPRMSSGSPLMSALTPAKYPSSHARVRAIVGVSPSTISWGGNHRRSRASRPASRFSGPVNSSALRPSPESSASISPIGVPRIARERIVGVCRGVSEASHRRQNRECGHQTVRTMNSCCGPRTVYLVLKHPPVPDELISTHRFDACVSAPTREPARLFAPRCVVRSQRERSGRELGERVAQRVPRQCVRQPHARALQPHRAQHRRAAWLSTRAARP